MSLIRRWFLSSHYRQGLDLLLEQAPAPGTELRARLDWVARLVDWIRTAGPNATELKLKVGQIETARAKYILQVLDHNPILKARAAECLRSVIRDSRALELFMHVGVANQQGFIGEFLERLLLKILPQAPHDKDLVSVFSETFRFESDAEWIRQMDPKIFQGWLDLFNFSNGAPILPWNTMIRDARDALYLLGYSVRAMGLSRLVRNRVAHPDFRTLPFFELPGRIDTLLAAKDEANQSEAYRQLDSTLDRCFATIDEVYHHFRSQGVSISLVYQIECLKTQLKRCRRLAKLLAGPTLSEQGPTFIKDFFGLLVAENIRERKLSTLLKDNLVLVCQKIVETNAETGEHYITRDRSEYVQILKKSWGGGFLTGFTTLFKFGLSHLTAPPFIQGLFATANYSLSFLGLQVLGFTLATKQPAMTATALAEKIEESSDSVQTLVDEVVHLVRSQFAAVVGNLSTVVPTVMLIDWVVHGLGSHLTDANHAQQIMGSFSILGMTPIYAAWTGVLLWVSSVFAGWFGNWFNFRGLPEAIEHHRRLRYVLGADRTKAVANLARSHVAGVAASVSLAFLLGLSPVFAAFLGIPLDVRHVTLSSGALTAAAMSIGTSVFSSWDFWLAVLGIGSMGILNLAVSFSLALTVAIWSKKAEAPRRSLIYRALLSRLARQPWILFFPASKHAA